MKGIYPAYIKIDTNRYREAHGVPFEYFKKGQKILHRPGVTVSQDDNRYDSLNTLNICGAHIDANYVKLTAWPDHCLGVTTMTIQTVIGMTWRTFAKKKNLISFEEVLMTSPVFEGDTLYAESEILETKEHPSDKECGIVTVLTQGVNDKKNVVTQLKYKLAIYKEGFHPLDSKDMPNTDDNPGFALFREDKEGNFIETTGLFFDEIKPGLILEDRPGKTITSEELRSNSLHYLERSPQYSDKEYIDKYLGGKAQVNEIFILSTVIGLTTHSLGRGSANLGMYNVEFENPVFVGDTINTVTEIISTRVSKSRPGQGIINMKTNAYNQNNRKVCSFERHLLYYCKDTGPYDNTGF
ncbi:MaoC family dehydratase [Francisella sp. SYW-9]|uniref:MaoC family dehydratase n=1 Tax=Francisella sp. SYW-9 TaxID=2610888 RepID=UPI00123E077F|nr:MaoC family dehydratase [Francisella sp. SYW-9]